MTTDQIDKMIVETLNWNVNRTMFDGLRRLVRVAVEAEREACAKVADEHIKQVDDYHHTYQSGIVVAAGNIAAAIRNRKEQP